MEYLNKIEIRGVVGRAETSTYGDSRVCKFSVATDYSYRDRENTPIIETTWFTVNAWEGRNTPDLDQIQKGTWIKVTGRIRTNKFIGQDGFERNAWDIQAGKVEILTREDDPMQPQRFL